MPAGIYLHIPFCKSRCSYCDFATDVWRSNDAVERYVTALCREITTPGRNASVNERALRQDSSFSERLGRDAGTLVDTTGRNASVNERAVGRDSSFSEREGRTEGTLVNTRLSARTYSDTIYFGGGTPSLLNPEQLERILAAVKSKFDIDPAAEITMEMNPATVSPETLTAFRSLGVNRASFGVQTFDDRSLRLLARGHDANDARETFKMLRAAGFDNVSFDLIAGLPGQTLEAWKKNLDEAVAMSPEHLSLYLLEIHQGTPLAEQVRSRRQPEPDPELAAEMYELMLERLAAAGYTQYEISNFSRPGYGSRHNSKYWTLDPVFGFGVSAHSFDGAQRYANERHTARYVEMIVCESTAEVMREDIDVASEFVFLGLRLEDGIDLSAFRERFGFCLLTKYRGDIETLVDSGLLVTENERLRLSLKGKLYSNEVFAVFV